MTAEDAGSRVSYNGCLIKQPVLCAENLVNLRKVEAGILLG
jgi:hypothetical protein